MSAMLERSANMAGARSDLDLLRRRLMSQSDVKRTQCGGRSQNRQLMRGGRA